MKGRQENSDARIFIIGDFLFEPSIGLISGNAGAHRVCAETAALLLYLVEHSGEEVPQERLIAELRAGDPDAEQALTSGIERLRHYFYDETDPPRYIEHTPSGGYRLIAPVYGDNGQRVKGEGRAGLAAPTGTRRIAEFVLELRDRKVCRAMLLYAIAVWLIAQVSEVFAPALALPDWFTTFVIVVGILGFPIAALLAWVFEIKPEGIVIDLPRQAHPRAPPPRNRLEFALDTSMIVAAVLLSGHLLLDTFSGDAIASADAVRTTSPFNDGDETLHRIAISPLSVSGTSEEAQAIAHHFLDQMIRSLLEREELIVVWRDQASNTTSLVPEDRIDSVFKGFVFENGGQVSISVYLLDARSNVYLTNRVLAPAHLGDEALEREVEATTREIIRVVAAVSPRAGERYRYAQESRTSTP